MESNGLPKEKAGTTEAGFKLMRKVSEIPEAIYGAPHEGKLYLFNPTSADIQSAIDKNHLEERGYQSHKDELEAEWVRGSQGNVDEYCRLQRDYHARRIAKFAVDGWAAPIELAMDGSMIDGTHRLKAAIHRGIKEVEIKIL